MALYNITNRQEFEEKVLQSANPVLVDFGRPGVRRAVRWRQFYSKLPTKLILMLSKLTRKRAVIVANWKENIVHKAFRT